MKIGRTILMTGLAAAALAFGLANAQAGGCAGGECYEKVVTPPVYGSVAEEVMVAPPRTVSRVIPGEFATVPQFVTIRPEHTVARHAPAEYATVSEKVLVSPGGKRWVVRRDHHGREIGCWEYEPPRYAVRHRTVVVRPASVIYERVPAVTAVREQQVMVRPPSIARETIPAVYTTRHRTVMVSPGSASWRPIGHRHHRGY